ncbi:10637_t:CDS:2 [Paraglomus brasilianum]|uniref:10637_t:CDS:1 n=1 Tax=Paraglomus brasilianum TaxID=144538 RepID=A0A9N9BNK7_9GLOM|nr:10637_t:CDS:2 [Paraglomus brasilianum]
MVGKFGKIWRKLSEKKPRKEAPNKPINNDRQEAPRDTSSPPAAPEVTFNGDFDSLRRAIASPLFKAEPVNGEIPAINLGECPKEDETSGDITKESTEKTRENTAYNVSEENASDTAKSDKQTNQSLLGSHPPCTRSKEGYGDETEVIKRVSIVNSATMRVTKYIEDEEDEEDLLPVILKDIASNELPSHLPTDVTASQSIRIVTPIQGVYLVSSPTTHMMITRAESSTPTTNILLLTYMAFQLVIEHMAFILEWIIDRPVGIPLGSWLRYYIGPLSY